MFKAPTKKRKQPTILSKRIQRSASESEDDSENRKRQIRRKKKKSKSGRGTKAFKNSSRIAGAISFAIDDDGDGHDENVSNEYHLDRKKTKKNKKKAKKRSGVGFGVLPAYTEEDEKNPSLKSKWGEGFHHSSMMTMKMIRTMKKMVHHHFMAKKPWKN